MHLWPKKSQQPGRLCGCPCLLAALVGGPGAGTGCRVGFTAKAARREPDRSKPTKTKTHQPRGKSTKPTGHSIIIEQGPRQRACNVGAPSLKPDIVHSVARQSCPFPAPRTEARTQVLSILALAFLFYALLYLSHPAACFFPSSSFLPCLLFPLPML